MRQAAGVIPFFLVLVGLACSLPAAIESPATQQSTPLGVTSPSSVDETSLSSGDETSPTRDPASGLQPVGVSSPTPANATLPTSVDETSPSSVDETSPSSVDETSPSSADETSPTPTVTHTPMPTVEPTLDVQSSPSPTALPEINLDPVTTQADQELGRPRLSGQMQALDTQHFRVHYTLKGEDAVVASDTDGNNQPDYVEAVARALEYSWQVQIDQFGWAPPPPDGGIGGDERYDVYLQNILFDGTAGLADGGYAQTFVGDNPLTQVVETRSSSSYVTLDNDYAELDKWGDEDITSTALMQSTVAHEFHHAIQYGYDGDEPASWLWEASATWIQDEVFDDINDAKTELESVFKSPDTCQTSEGLERVESDGRWYGMWVYLRYISEQYGHSAVRAIWEHSRRADGYTALASALAEHGADLNEIQLGFQIALLLRDFEEGTSFPVLRLEGIARAREQFVPVDGVGQMAADYVEIASSETVRVQLLENSLQGTLVGLRAGEAYIYPLSENALTVDAAQFERTYLIVTNLAQTNSELNCDFRPYTVAVGPGGQPASPTIITPAPNFIAPEVEPLQDVEGYYTSGETIDPPTELVPDFLPPEYFFSESYLLPKSDFGLEEDAIWYVPGVGPATVLDFYGPGDSFISITASDSPFGALADWLLAVDYAPWEGEERTINEIPVLLIDYSEPDDPYTSATFLYHLQFIVVDGTINDETMVQVVTSLITELE